ncbi:transporter substrate-binding domain-containing protein [Massilia sp. RP-1-19]|uniref:Transporter substrate-binding domain-containing protein n=2 Tax=Massilia polaris TaxID=2728846 RepID=A0A848HKL0_9BURK|nr:transporter substrate-binding domain-containing protein [Massilia polaris]
MLHSLMGFLLAASLGQGHAAAPSLDIATEESPPASMVDGRTVIGSSTAKVREIMARSGLRYRIDLLPWKRAYTSALRRDNGCVYSTTRTPEREHLFHWIGPLDEAEWVLLARADRGYQFKTLEDARGLRIGTYNGDAREEYLRSRGFNIDSANNDLINPRKLLLNRIDLWAASLRRGSYVLEQNDWSSRIVPVFTFRKVQVYLACNKRVPAATAIRMQGARDAMERDGTSRRIERKYEAWEKHKAKAP